MQRLAEAVTHPAFPLFLGRRSCPPEGRLSLGLRDAPLEAALTQEPSLTAGSGRQETETVRIVLEDAAGPARMRDVPISFSPYHREYGYRAAQETWMTRPAEKEHDPMGELR